MKVKEVKEKIKNIDELCKDFASIQKACYEQPRIKEEISDYTFGRRVNNVESVLINAVDQLAQYKNILEKAIEEAEVNL